MKIKKLTALFLSGLMTLSLAGCSGSKPAASAETVSKDTGKQITLRMAWWGSQTRHDATNKVIELYESQNPNVNIEAEFYDFDSYFTKLDTLVAADDVWDIFQLGGNFPKYIKNIEPLDGYIKNGIINTSDTTENFLATTRDNNGSQIAGEVSLFDRDDQSLRPGQRQQ